MERTDNLLTNYRKFTPHPANQCDSFAALFQKRAPKRRERSLLNYLPYKSKFEVNQIINCKAQKAT